MIDKSEQEQLLQFAVGEHRSELDGIPVIITVDDSHCVIVRAIHSRDKKRLRRCFGIKSPAPYISIDCNKPVLPKFDRE